MARRPGSGVVVTGIGLTTPVGCDPDEFFDALCSCRSGIVRPPEDHPSAGLFEAVGLGPVLDPYTLLVRHEARFVDRFLVLALAAARDAMADARLEVGRDVDPLRTAVVVSTGAGGLLTFEQQSIVRQSLGPLRVSAYLYPRFLPNMAAARIAIEYGIQGYSSTIATACAASAHAVAEALRLIRAGDADVVVCGGSESPLGPTGVAGFANARALAEGWPDPREASRPFDLQRNGFVLGEGAGILVVARADHADGRGVAGYADLLGWGATTDAYHTTAPHPDGTGAVQSMRRAIADAGLSPADIDYVNAHGTSTQRGDLAEARAIRTVFGAAGPAVSSTKGCTGHLLGAAGVVEAAASILAIGRGVAPPTNNLHDPDPACDVDLIRKAPRPMGITAALSNSLAFGGHNVSLVFGPPTTGRVRHASVPAQPEQPTQTEGNVTRR